MLKRRGVTKSTLMEDVALSNPVVTPKNTTDYDAQCFLLANTDAQQSGHTEATFIQDPYLCTLR